MLWGCEACSVMVSLLRSTCTPIWASNVQVVSISRRLGTLCKLTASVLSRLAHRMGRAAFLAPEIVISPCRGLPPTMRSLSIPFSLVFLGGQHAHGQGVDLSGLNAPAKRLINALMAANAVQPLKLGADDGGLIMVSIALYLYMLTVQIINNQFTYLLWGRSAHV